MKPKIQEHFKKHDPALHAIIAKIPKFEIKKSDDYFADLCSHIISQQLSIRVGEVIFTRFKNLFPKQEIVQQTLLKYDNETLRKVGMSYTKVSYLKDLAQKIITKELNLSLLDEETDERVIEELTKVKGIGKWTAEMFLMNSLARKDVFSYGDLGIRKAIQKLYKLNNEPTQKQAEKIAKNWIPYRTYACKILWRYLAL